MKILIFIILRLPLESDFIIFNGNNERIEFYAPSYLREFYLNIEGLKEFEVFLNGNFYGKYEDENLYHTINLNKNVLKGNKNLIFIKPSKKTNFKITLWGSRFSWFYGTFHIHTTYSDGNYSVHEILSMINEEGGHFAAITDHNTLEQCNDTGFHTTGNCEPIRATEWTSDSGHANCLGAQGSEPFELLSIRKMIDDATYRGALVQINHPCDDELNMGWDHYPNLDKGIDAIEIFNNVIWFPKNGIKSDEEAVLWWHELLCEKKRISATGNSDFHGWEPGGGPLKAHSAVYASSNHPDTILKRTKLGYVMACSEMDDSRLYIYADTNGNGIMDIIMGENIIINQGNKNIKFKVEVENSDLFDELRIYSSQGLLYSETLLGGNYVYEFEKNFSYQDTDFIRAEIKNFLGYYETATNPIYINYPDYELGPCSLSITWQIPDTINNEKTIYLYLKNLGLVSPYRFSIFAMVDTNEFHITEYQNSGPGIGEVIYNPDFYGYEILEWRGGFEYDVRLSPDTEFSYFFKIIPKSNGLKSVYTRGIADDRIFIIDKKPYEGFLGPDNEKWYKIDLYSVKLREYSKNNNFKKEKIKIFDLTGRMREYKSDLKNFKKGIYFFLKGNKKIKKELIIK
jgi:hypothetical protein